jgi:hypothetical protein
MVDKCMNGVFVLAASGKPGASPQFDLVGPAKHRMYDRDPGDIDNTPAMNSDKFGWVEPSFQAGQGFVDQVLPWAAVELSVIIGGFDPVD